MTMSLPMTVTAPARPARILAALAESPGQGAYELAAALGYDGRRTAAALKRMQSGGAVVALELARPGAGRPARIYFAAPEGTPPPPRRRESPAETEERRRRARVAQQRRRARLAGKPVTAGPITRPRLHLPAAPPAWRLPGEPACSGADPGLFFGPEFERPQARAQRVAAAKAVCTGCPARRSCIDGALARGERWGVWGGVDLEARPRVVRPA
jgi:WhiB family redox-sensing transcriptional regulator